MRTFLLSIFSICIFSSHLLQAAPLTETEKFFVLKQAKGKYEKDTDGDGRADRRDAFPYDPTEWLDTDRDGTGNNADTDDDNDGIPDTDDAFPLDKTEWLDSDKDGIGNNADTDDDNDGVLDRDDKFPTDPAEGPDQDGDGIGDNRDQYDEDAMCWRVEDADANGCLLTQLGSLQANQVAGDGGNTIVFIDKAGQKLYRYALDSKTITLRQELTEINSSAKHILIYHKQHQKYYFTESNGRQLFSLTATGASATLQRELPSMSYQLHDAGKFLVVELVNDGIYDGKSLIINSSGATTTQQSTYFGQNTVFDPNHKRLFHFRDGSSPNDVYWREINQTSGVLGAVLESPYHGSFSIIGPIRVSNDGKRVLLGSGDVYNSADLTWRSNLGGRHVDAQYLENGESVVVRHVGEAENKVIELVRQNSAGLNLEVVSWSGTPVSLLQSGKQSITLYKIDNQLRLHVYAPSDDTDGDGVPNQQDDFPTDPSAAVDTDGDGAPDSWLAGKSAADSNSGLTLDAFMLDSACQLSTHANAQGQCDIAARIPAELTPDQIASDNSGIIYLYSKSNQRIYRWSTLQQQYLNPLILNRGQVGANLPVSMALHALHQRIYLAYAGGRITALNLSNGREQFFASTALTANIHAAGKFLLAQDSSGAWNSHYVFAASGLKTDRKEWKNPLTTLVWLPQLNRYLHTRPDTSPNDIEWSELNLDGEIVNSGDSPYHGDIYPGNMLLASPDHTRVLSNSGYVFAAESLQTIGSRLPVEFFTVASWQPTLLLLGKDQTVHGLHSDTLQTQFSQTLTGNIVHIAASAQQATVVLQHNGQLSFHLIPLGDLDNDQLPDWWEQVHGFDNGNAADATTDIDDDGLTQLQEYVSKTNPRVADSDNDGLTDGQELLTYNTSPLLADTDNDGLSDGIEVLEHQTNPLLVDSDADGLSDFLEIINYQTNPNTADTDSDGIDDLWEVENGTDAKVADATADPDHDGLTNLEEQQQKTWPTMADTDSDGLNDGPEVKLHQTNPLVADTDGDQMPDGYEIQYNLNPKLASDAGLDPDLDKFTNLEEFSYHSLPNDGLSRPQTFQWRTMLGDTQQRAVQPLKHADLSLSLVLQQAHQLTGTVMPPVHSDNSISILSRGTSNNGYQFASFSPDGQELLRRDVIGSAIRYGTFGNELLLASSDGFLRGYDLVNAELMRKDAIPSLRGEGTDLITDQEYFYWSSDNTAYQFRAETNSTSWQVQLEHYYPFGHVVSIGTNRLAINGTSFVARGLYHLMDSNPGVASIARSSILTNCLQQSHATPNHSGVGFAGVFAQIGSNHQLYTLGSECVASYEQHNVNTLWEVNGSTGTQLAVLPDKIAAVLNNSQLALLDSKTGSVLKNWTTPNNKKIIYGPIATLSHVFVGTDSDTYALDQDSLTVRWQYQVSGYLTLQPDHKLYVTNQQNVSVFALNTDTDQDGMPDWWEQQYQLNSANAADATADKDNDGLTNREEYQAGSRPDLTDTDGDTLSDLAEVKTHATHPAKADTDGDMLNDNVELQTHLTNPKKADTDSDGYHDGLEVLVYKTDPLRASSKPAAWASVAESFENISLLAPGWTLGGFFADKSETQHGQKSLRSPPIGHSQTATLKLEQEFVKGTLSFYYKTDSELCCDGLQFWVDGELILAPSRSGWTQVTHPLTLGRHTLEWRYRKDGSVVSGKDALFIDNLRFTAN